MKGLETTHSDIFGSSEGIGQFGESWKEKVLTQGKPLEVIEEGAFKKDMEVTTPETASYNVYQWNELIHKNYDITKKNFEPVRGQRATTYRKAKSLQHSFDTPKKSVRSTPNKRVNPRRPSPNGAIKSIRGGSKKVSSASQSTQDGGTASKSIENMAFSSDRGDRV